MVSFFLGECSFVGVCACMCDCMCVCVTLVCVFCGSNITVPVVPQNPQNISLQESLQMEVAKQAEELKRNLALLEEFHKDPSRAVANLAKVDPSLASISSVGPREGRGRRGHTHTAPVMGLQVGVLVLVGGTRWNTRSYSKHQGQGMAGQGG